MNEGSRKELRILGWLIGLFAINSSSLSQGVPSISLLPKVHPMSDVPKKLTQLLMLLIVTAALKRVVWVTIQLVM